MSGLSRDTCLRFPLRLVALFLTVLIALTACRVTAETTMHTTGAPAGRAPAAQAPAAQAPASIASATEVPAPNAPTPTITVTPDEAESEFDSDEADRANEADGSGRQSPLDSSTAGRVDFSLVRDDIDCDEETLNEDSGAVFSVAHVVVDGSLGGACFGEPDERLTRAWMVLASITPPDQLRDLGLFGGFGSSEEDEVTLAFVNALDFDGSLFQMSVNLAEAEADPDEMMLTMAHEFAHVFTSLSTQIDRDVDATECTTFYNGEGCFLDDSLIFEWVQLFWGDGLIDQIDPFEEPSNEDGEARCDLNGGFLGPYAASHPEEDFAEAFSAYVFQLEVDTAGLQAKMDWFARQPGLVEFRDRAIAAGFGPLENFFGICGG